MLHDQLCIAVVCDALAEKPILLVFTLDISVGPVQINKKKKLHFSFLFLFSF